MDVAMMGRLFLALGIGLLILGGLFLLFSRVPGLNQFGRLPGDISYQNGNFACFMPIVSMCLLSLLATIILNVIARIFSR